MLEELNFKYDGNQYIINVEEKTLLIKSKNKSTRGFFHLDELNYGESWVVCEKTLSKTDEMLWEYFDIKINFKYTKDE
ncbi:MAG: hypothetical protein ACJAWW_002498 [Sulfurimonas sp.]|jgi:hypothetical protein